MQPNSRQIAMWNEAGHTWAALQSVLERLFQPLSAAIVDAIGPIGSGRVLDVGCGAGDTTLALSQALGSGVHLTGIDISRPLIDVAKSRAAESTTGTVSFIEADAQTFHASEPFDAVVSRLGVMFFDDPVDAFRNLRNVTRPSGRLVFLCWRSRDSNPFMMAVEKAVSAHQPSVPPAADDVPGQFGLASRERLEGILGAGGWQDITVSALDLPCQFAAEHLPSYATQMGPYGRVRQTLDDASRAQADAAAIAALEPFRDGPDVRLTAALWRVTARA